MTPFRRLLPWLLLAVLSLAAGIFAWRYFAVAIPLVAVDIRMDREAALAAAADLARAQRLGPGGADVRQAARFEGSGRLQAFVEREAGGKAAFVALVGNDALSPYSWSVRRFVPGNEHEAVLVFRPDGRPFGFVERLPEAARGPALDAPSARTIAEQAASDGWSLDLTRYRLVESAARTRPGGRVDHTFTYEHSAMRVGAATVRLRLGVGGDRLTTVQRFVQVPDDFDRRYAALRTGNDAIASAATIGVGLLLVCGVGGGLLLLLRRHALAWRGALWCGGGIAVLQLIAGLSDWPLVWASYDTAVRPASFVAQWLIGVVVGAGGLATMLMLTFAAAEGLTRLAFPDEPQLWRLWSRDGASTLEVWDRSALGYLLVPIDLAYVVGLYFITTRYFGWWTPSDVLVDPNVLASVLPWSSPVANALQAGLWEEALFRAIPLAGGALLGQRFGRRGLGIVIAMIVQTVIFGAGHANYPGSPAWARPVELIVPSLLFGYLYLRAGLLPGMLLHAAYDLVLMALPVLAASSPRLWDDKAIVTLVLLAPAIVLAAQRVRRGAWTTLPDALRNRHWTRPTAPAQPVVDEARPEIGRIPAWVMPWALAIGLVATLAAVAVLVTRDPRVVRVTAGRAEVERTARDALVTRGVDVGAPWRLSSGLETRSPGLAHDFVRETAGAATYRTLVGDWLLLPSWRVRLARFDGPVEARAEEWSAQITRDGGLRQVTHHLPEARQAPSLSEVDARVLSRETLRTRLGVELGQIQEVEATPRKLPARTDWTFTLRRIAAPVLPSGELRYQVAISGNAVTSVGRSIYIPETWTRARRDRAAVLRITSAVGLMAFGVLFFGSLGAAVVAWARGALAGRLMLVFGALQFGAGLVGLFLGWPSMLHGLQTTRPAGLQILISLGGSLVALVFVSVLAYLPLGLVPRWVRGRIEPDEMMAFRTGIALGVLGLPVTWLAAAVQPERPLAWMLAGQASSLLPWLSPAVTLVSGLALAGIAVVGLAACSRLTADWTRHRLLTTVLTVVCVTFALGPRGLHPVWSWGPPLAAAVTLLALYVVVLRRDVSLAILMIGVRLCAAAVETAVLRPFPGAIIGGLIALPLGIVLTVWLWRIVRQAIDRAGPQA